MGGRHLFGHQTHVTWKGEKLLTLADLVPPNPAALFIGYNPRPESVAAGHYYQGTRGKQFWHYLVAAEFISRPEAGQFHDDLMYHRGYGLSDLSKRPGKHAIDIEESDVRLGRPLLLRKIKRWEPEIICWVFKGALEKLYERPLAYGLNRLDSVDQPVFVIPFPPGKYVTGARIEASLEELRKVIDDR